MTALTAGGPDTDGTADEDGADGDALGRPEGSADAVRVDALCDRPEAAASTGPAEQPVLAAVIAIRAATAPVRAARLVTSDVTGIIVASWHGPARHTGDPVKS
ncbi:MAG TPA: hypothetical protein VK836_17705, partial [Streptosporangiaceae bacterium]|nr:hypothetical protein [Streptosporangiaceae bacterium]